MRASIDGKICIACKEPLVMGKNYRECDINPYGSPKSPMCAPCHNLKSKEYGNNRIVFRLPSGEFKQVRHRDKKSFLNKNTESIFVGKFNRSETSFDEFVKSANSGVIPAIPPKIKKKRFKTAKQAAREIMARVKTINSDRTINRYARTGERKLWANLHDSEGNLLKWFEDKWNSATHCELSGIEFQVEGPFSKSPDQKIPGGGYGEDNVRVVCQIYNFCKHTYTDEIVFDFVKRASSHLDKQVLSQ